MSSLWVGFYSIYCRAEIETGSSFDVMKIHQQSKRSNLKPTNKYVGRKASVIDFHRSYLY